MKRHLDARKIEKIIILWALLASIAYFVQKATVNYTFDYGFVKGDEVTQYEKRFGEIMDIPSSLT